MLAHAYGPEGVLYSSRGLCPRNMSTVSLFGSSSIRYKVDWCINHCLQSNHLPGPTEHACYIVRWPRRATHRALCFAFRVLRFALRLICALRFAFSASRFARFDVKVGGAVGVVGTTIIGYRLIAIRACACLHDKQVFGTKLLDLMLSVHCVKLSHV